MEPRPKVCRVCLLEHDEEIHAATLSLRHWFHEQVMLAIYYQDLEALAAEPETDPLAVACTA